MPSTTSTASCFWPELLQSFRTGQRMKVQFTQDLKDDSWKVKRSFESNIDGGFGWQLNMELQSIFLSFSASCPFWKMVPRDLNIHIYHISTVYVKLYQIRISFITFIPDVFITCGMPKWRRKFMFSVLNGLALNWNGPSTSPTAVSHLSLYCFACS